MTKDYSNATYCILLLLLSSSVIRIIFRFVPHNASASAAIVVDCHTDVLTVFFCFQFVLYACSRQAGEGRGLRATSVTSSLANHKSVLRERASTPNEDTIL